jgi:hypothetical protein
MLAHLVEIFIKDPLRVVPYTLRGLVSSIDVCMDSFSSLFNVLRVQMPQNVDPEDGLIYDILRKSENLGHSAQTAKVLAGKLGRSVDEMKSRGLTVEMRHVNSLEGCYQESKSLTDYYRKVTKHSKHYTYHSLFRNSRKYRCILLLSIRRYCSLVLTV